MSPSHDSWQEWFVEHGKAETVENYDSSDKAIWRIQDMAWDIIYEAPEIAVPEGYHIDYFAISDGDDVEAAQCGDVLVIMYDDGTPDEARNIVVPQLPSVYGPRYILGTRKKSPGDYQYFDTPPHKRGYGRYPD